MKEIYEYLLKVYEVEVRRRKTIEDKAKFVFSVNSLIIGSFLLKFSDLFKATNSDSNITCFTTLLPILCFVCIIVSLFFIMKTFEKQPFKGIYPDNIVDNLFNPETLFYTYGNDKSFLDSVSKHIALSIENNRVLLSKKNKMLSYSFRFLTIGIAIMTFKLLIDYYYAY